MKMLNRMKIHFISSPKIERRGFLSCLPQEGHLNAESLTSFRHSGQLTKAITIIPIVTYWFLFVTKHFDFIGSFSIDKKYTPHMRGLF
ncbi:Uncharacterised protein [Klebsiella pneumoniae]|nr:Uncharacterised protein [Klebsiella pneumoniae]